MDTGFFDGSARGARGNSGRWGKGAVRGIRPYERGTRDNPE